MSNRLIHEKSPYLLQHAHNPVNWYPWGEEAFVKARSEDKPIFLSIGYSTCYWCHVMEREVFENETIAALMNEKLVSIKIDREEQPDLDRIYMTAVQAMTGSGGWPLSVFLTHELKPFFGGTYFPPDSKYGKPGFPQLVERISELWQSEQSKILESSNSIVDYLSNAQTKQDETPLNETVLSNCHILIKQAFDPIYGGFGHAPKFPRPVVFNALLHYYASTGDWEPLTMTVKTLRKMAEGGMHDHLGGGFHRYSTDEQWRIPHFEKMLYDQAQLASSYLDAYQITHDENFATIARSTLDYVLRVMTHPEGGFYSAEDAESAFSHESPKDKKEGVFYLWTKEELDQLLGNDAALVCSHFGVTEQGNALADPMGVFQNKNILFEQYPLDGTAKRFNISSEEGNKILSRAKKVLFDEREKRPHPHLDDKIITAWNGLMISAFARAYQILDEQKYLDAASNAARFIFKHSFTSETQTLSRRWRDGEARFDASLQDYSFLVQGLIDLYEASFEIEWIKKAIELTSKQIELFWDSKHGGFFDSQENDSRLLLRMKEDYDGAEPTGNSIAAMNLLRLSHLTSNNDLKNKAEQTINAFSAILSTRPDVLPQMVCALSWLLSPPKETIIAGKKNAPDTNLILKEIHFRYIPNKVVLLADGTDNQRFFEGMLPMLTSMQQVDGKATLYFCENFACQLPTTDIAAIRQLLNHGK